MSLFQVALIQNPVGIDLLALVRAISFPDTTTQRTIGDAIRAEYQSNFNRQRSGAGAWPRLAPSTVADRIRNGFPGQRPILIRTGDLLSGYTDAGHGDHHEEMTQTGLGPRFEAGNKGRIAIFHARGTSRMPARPVAIFDSQSENRLFQQIERALSRIEGQYL
jgi:hypothetical protein